MKLTNQITAACHACHCIETTSFAPEPVPVATSGSGISRAKSRKVGSLHGRRRPGPAKAVRRAAAEVGEGSGGSSGGVDTHLVPDRFVLKHRWERYVGQEDGSRRSFAADVGLNGELTALGCGTL